VIVDIGQTIVDSVQQAKLEFGLDWLVVPMVRISPMRSLNKKSFQTKWKLK
jgi:hypothetical protein